VELIFWRVNVTGKAMTFGNAEKACRCFALRGNPVCVLTFEEFCGSGAAEDDGHKQTVRTMFPCEACSRDLRKRKGQSLLVRVKTGICEW